MQQEEGKDGVNAIRKMATGKLDETRFLTAGKLSYGLVSMIGQQIETNQIQVNEVQKQFKIKQKSFIDDKDNKRIADLYKQKMTVELELENLEKQQVRHRNAPSLSHESRYYKSELTQQDKEKIKKIKQMQQKYEQQLENKAKIYEQNLKKFHQEEKQLLEKQRKEKNEERLKEVAKKIEEIRMRQDQRKKKIEDQRLRIQQIKNQKTLHEKFSERFKSNELEEQKKKQELKMAIKQQKMVNFEDIKVHEKKYDDIMRTQKEERDKKLGQLGRGNSKKYYQSKMLKDMLQEEEKNKVEHIQKKKEMQQKHLKKQEYAEYVKNNYRPNIPLKETEKQKEEEPVKSMSVADLHKIGNEYMKQAHENMASLKGSNVSKITEIKEDGPRYKDYLKEIKADRKMSTQKQPRYLQQIDNLLKKGNITQEQKFYKAKLLTQKIEQKKGRDSQKLIDSINAKIYLLKQIEPTQ